MTRSGDCSTATGLAATAGLADTAIATLALLLAPAVSAGLPAQAATRDL
jgi:hypothetical protein